MDKKNEKDLNALGHKQSDYAGTNTERYGPPAPESEQDNPITTGNEAQNIKDDTDRLTEEEAKKAVNKANEGARQERSK